MNDRRNITSNYVFHRECVLLLFTIDGTRWLLLFFFLIRSLFIFSCMYIHTRERHDFFNGVLSLASYMYNKSYSASNSFISYTQEKKKKKQERNKTNTTHSRYLMARDENNQIKIKIVIVIVTLQSNQMRGIGGREYTSWFYFYL